MNDSHISYYTALRCYWDCQSTANLEVNLKAIKHLIEFQGARVPVVSCRPNQLCTNYSAIGRSGMATGDYELLNSFINVAKYPDGADHQYLGPET